LKNAKRYKWCNFIIPCRFCAGQWLTMRKYKRYKSNVRFMESSLFSRGTCVRTTCTTCVYKRGLRSASHGVAPRVAFWFSCRFQLLCSSRDKLQRKHQDIKDLFEEEKFITVQIEQKLRNIEKAIVYFCAVLLQRNFWISWKSIKETLRWLWKIILIVSNNFFFFIIWKIINRIRDIA